MHRSLKYYFINQPDSLSTSFGPIRHQESDRIGNLVAMRSTHDAVREHDRSQFQGRKQIPVICHYRDSLVDVRHAGILFQMESE